MRRFTLVELMIVVALIMILAAIAVPQFQSMQLKAKRGELAGNLRGIFDAQRAYYAAHDTMLTVSQKPVLTSVLGKQFNSWVTGTAFDSMGWAPDGQVRGTYWAVTGGSMAVCPAVGASVWQGGAEGAIDVDDDNAIAYAACCGNVGCYNYTANNIY